MIERKRNNYSHCTSPEVSRYAGENAPVWNRYKEKDSAHGGNRGLRAGVNFHLRANVVERRHHHNSPDIAPVARARLRSAHSSPYCGQTPPGRSTCARPALHFCSAGRSHFRSRRGMRGETSLYVSSNGAYRSCCKAYQRRVRAPAKPAEVTYGLPKNPSVQSSQTLPGCFIRPRTQRRKSLSNSIAASAMSSFVFQASRAGLAMQLRTSLQKCCAVTECGISKSNQNRRVA